MRRASIFSSDMTMISYFNIIISMIIITYPTFSRVLKIDLEFIRSSSLKCLLLLLIINQHAFFTKLLGCINWMFFLIFITKNTNADGISFFSFLCISNSDWKLYVFKIIIFGKIYINFCDSSWLMVYRM